VDVASEAEAVDQVRIEVVIVVRAVPLVECSEIVIGCATKNHNLIEVVRVEYPMNAF
jgi:hypothetical protein